MLSTRLAALALAAVALTASGCGGSSKTTSQAASTGQAPTTTQTPAPSTLSEQPAPTTAPLSSATLIAKADLICARMDAARAANVIKTKQQALDSVGELSAEEQRALGEMYKFTPPTSLQKSWSTMLNGYREIAMNIIKVRQALAEDRNREIPSLLSAGTRTQQQMAAIARSAGFKDCGKALQ